MPRHSILYDIPPDDLERFWGLVQRRKDDECWPWLGSMGGGQGVFSWGSHPNQRTAAPHRMVYAQEVGAITVDLSVCHKHEGPACCNPAHLTLKTHAQNMTDRAQWRRAKKAGGAASAEGETSWDAEVHRFWLDVDRIRDDGEACWRWLGNDQRMGYGSVFFMGRRQGAHRVAYEIEHGPIPGGASICHRCDNPPCCRPSHLFLGTHQDNMDDMAAKGRTRMGGVFRLTDSCPDCGELADLCQCPRAADG